jgi:hypothetical protein
LKISLILAVAKFQTELTEEDVLQANTILSHAEVLMPKAMGEFGKSKTSDVANKVVSYLETVSKPASIKEIWGQVHKDLAKLQDLVDIMIGLQQADRVQSLTGVLSGFLLKKKPRTESKYVDWSFLSDEEKDMIG